MFTKGQRPNEHRQEIGARGENVFTKPHRSYTQDRYGSYLIYDLVYTYREETKFIDSKGKYECYEKKRSRKDKKSPVQFDQKCCCVVGVLRN
jgi:hypothetical protein